MELGRVGVWWSGSWRSEPEAEREPAAELEAMGYGALWSSGGFEPGLSPRFERLLRSTSTIVVASGIVSIWVASPEDVSSRFEALEQHYPGRFLLGIGSSHAALVSAYERPFTRVAAYLDRLDELGVITIERRMLAALRPQMLRLAAARSSGAHPYLVPVEHTARARALLGAGAFLAPEVTVAVDQDKAAALRLARRFVSGYLALPNYSENLQWLGWSEEEFSGGGSDRLVEALVSVGNVDDAVRRVRSHLEAGADHVCVQALSDDGPIPLGTYRALAEALI